MSARPVLTGYRFSVYTRAARIALAEKGVGFDYVEHDPFAEGAVGPHPFGRVPVLRHGDFEIYETAAIIGYVDDGFDGPGLMPEGARAVARVSLETGSGDDHAAARALYARAGFTACGAYAGYAEDPLSVFMTLAL